MLDDSDDDEDSDSDDDDEREERKIADKGGSKGEADATSSKPSGVRHPDGGDGLPAPPAAEGGERSLAASKSRKMLSLKERGEVDEKQQQQPAAKATAAAADDADDKALKHQHTNMSSESGSSMGEGGNTAAHNKQGPKVAQQVRIARQPEPSLSNRVKATWYGVNHMLLNHKPCVVSRPPHNLRLTRHLTAATTGRRR